MWEKVNKKAAEIFVVGLMLALFGLYISICYTYLSFYGVFNPIYSLFSMVFSGAVGVKDIFPKTIGEYQVLLDKPFNSWVVPFQPYIIGVVLFGIGVLTFFLCLKLSTAAAKYLLHVYIKVRFGSEYLSFFIFEQRLKENVQDKKTEKETQLESLKKAQHEHFKEWKKYHKSQLTYKEWKERFLNDSVSDDVNDRG